MRSSRAPYPFFGLLHLSHAAMTWLNVSRTHTFAGDNPVPATSPSSSPSLHSTAAAATTATTATAATTSATATTAVAPPTAPSVASSSSPGNPRRPARSLRVPRRAQLGAPPLLRRVANELAYTPTRCRVTASLLVSRVNPWWQRLPAVSGLPPDMCNVVIAPPKTNAPTGEPVRRVANAAAINVASSCPA